MSRKIINNGPGYLINNKFTDIFYFTNLIFLLNLEYVGMLQRIQENGIFLCDLGLSHDSLRDIRHFHVRFFKSDRLL